MNSKLSDHRDSAGRRPLRRSRSFKVTDLTTIRNPVCNFLLVNTYILSRTVCQTSRGIDQIIAFDRGAYSFYFWVFVRLCQFWWKSIKNCDYESAHRRTYSLTDANRFYNLSHAICYSYGTDNNLLQFLEGTALLAMQAAIIAKAILSVCLFVRPTRFGILSRRMKIRSCGVQHHVGQSF